MEFAPQHDPTGAVRELRYLYSQQSLVEGCSLGVTFWPAPHHKVAFFSIRKNLRQRNADTDSWKFFRSSLSCKTRGRWAGPEYSVSPPETPMSKGEFGVSFLVSCGLRLLCDLRIGLWQDLFSDHLILCLSGY